MKWQAGRRCLGPTTRFMDALRGGHVAVVTEGDVWDKDKMEMNDLSWQPLILKDKERSLCLITW